jgi:hypothetical protein
LACNSSLHEPIQSFEKCLEIRQFSSVLDLVKTGCYVAILGESLRVAENERRAAEN